MAVTRAALALLAACGSSALPTAPTITCGPGTRLDPSKTCVIDPDACGDGTVLIGDTCQDPMSGITVDLEEAIEPNGSGIGGIEPSAWAAGAVKLVPFAEPFVIHGHITPFEDLDHDGQPDPDIDTYAIAVDGPTLVDITVAGIGGLAGAFYVTGDELPALERYGASLTGNTATRRVFLPARGTYRLAIADLRSLYFGSTPPPIAGLGGAAGGPAAAYYATLRVVALPEPTFLADTASGTLGSVAFYRANLGSGLNHLAVATPAGSLIVVDGDKARVLGADALAGGYDPGRPVLIAVDATYNYQPAPYKVTVATAAATELCTGSVCNATVATTSGAFYFDATADHVDAFDLAWTHPLDAMIVDQDGTPVARFSGFTGATWQRYVGHIRYPRTARYYVLTDDPIAKVTVARHVAPVQVTDGDGGGAFNDPIVHGALLRYDPTTPWQQLDLVDEAGTPLAAQVFAPTAYGRLDPVPDCTGCLADTSPLFTRSYPADLGNGRIDAATSYVIDIHAAATPLLLDIAFTARDAADLGTLSAGDTVVRAGQTSGYYLVHTSRALDVAATGGATITWFAGDERPPHATTGHIPAQASGLIGFAITAAAPFDLTVTSP